MVLLVLRQSFDRSRDRDRVLAEMRRGWGMNAEEAIAYGIVDRIITTGADLPG